jgi:hypothetical protein
MGGDATRRGHFPKIVMGLCGAFFVHALATQGVHILRHRPPTFDGEGLHFDYLGSRKCLPWDNIRDAKTWRYMSTRISVLSLNDVGAFVSQFSPRHLRDAIRNENVGNFFMIVLGFLTPSGSSPDARDARAELARLLTLKRERFGGEICLATADLDRGADEFNALILAWKARYGR